MAKHTWAQEIQDGKLNAVYHEIKETLLKDNQERTALSVLVHLSKFVKREHISEDNDILYDLAVTCCEIFSSFDAQMKKTFLISLYHIMDYFVKQDVLDSGLKFQSRIVSVAHINHDSEEDEQILNLYLSSHCLFSRVAKDLEKKYEADRTAENCFSWLNIVKTALEFYIYSKNSACWKYALHSLLNSSKVEKEHQNLSDNFHCDVLNITSDLMSGTIVGRPDLDSFYDDFCLRLLIVFKHSFSSLGSDVYSCVIRKPVQFVRFGVGQNKLLSRCLDFLDNTSRAVIKHQYEQSNACFLGELKKINSEFDYLVHNYEDEKCVKDTAFCVASIIIEALSVWRMLPREEWNSIVTVEVQSGLYCLLLNVCECLCPRDEVLKGNVKSDLVVFVLCLFKSMMNCIYTSATNETTGHDKLFPQARAIIEEYVKLITFLKSLNSEHWATSWQALSVPTFNYAWVCLSREQYYHSMKFASEFCKAFFSLEDTYDSPVCFKDALVRALSMLISSYRLLQKFKGALVAVTVGLLSLPQSKKYFFEKWMEVKYSAANESSTQVITVMDILTKSWPKILKINPCANLDATDKCELLVRELEAYQSSRIDMGDSIEAAASLLFSSSADKLVNARGVLVYVRALWLKEDFNTCDKAIQMCERAISDLNEEVKDCNGSRKQLVLNLLGQLYYCLFLHKFKQTHAVEKAEVEATSLIPTEHSDEAYSGGFDPNDTCHQIPAYLNLTVVKEKEILHFLDLASNCWSEALLKGDITVEDISIKSILTYIEEISYIYAMYGFKTHMLRMWDLYYKIAEIIDDKKECLKGLINLIQIVNVNVDDSWLLKMEQLVNELNLEQSTDQDSKRLLLSYWLSRSWNCFYKSEYFEGISYLKLVKASVNSSYNVLFVWTQLLTAHYLLLSPRVVVPEDLNELGVLHVISCAYNALAYYVMKLAFSLTPSMYFMVLYTLMEFSLWRGEIHLWLRWPREARCYLKEDLIHAQKLSLPTRTAQFLSVLAQVDLLCGNIEDSEVKLNGMKYILESENIKPKFTPKKRQEQIDALTDKLKDLDIDSGFEREVMLDCPLINRTCSTTTGSPVLHRQSFSFPQFVRHPDSCGCTLCSNALYHILFVNLILGEAILNWYKGDERVAASFFNGGLKLQERLQKKHKACLQKFIPNCLRKDWLPFSDLIHRTLTLAYVKLLLYYSDFMGSKNQYKKALFYNQLVEDELKYVQVPDFTLEVTQQKYGIIEVLREGQLEVKCDGLEGHMSGAEEESETDGNTVMLFKTPVCSAKNVVLPINNTGEKCEITSPTSFRKPKPPVFHLSPPSSEELKDSRVENGHSAAQIISCTPIRKKFFTSSASSSLDTVTESSVFSVESLDDDVFLSPKDKVSSESSSKMVTRRVYSRRAQSEKGATMQKSNRHKEILSESTVTNMKKVSLETHRNTLSKSRHKVSSSSNSSECSFDMPDTNKIKVLDQCSTKENTTTRKNVKTNLKVKPPEIYVDEEKTIPRHQKKVLSECQANSSKKSHEVAGCKEEITDQEFPVSGNLTVKTLRTRKKICQEEIEKENKLFDTEPLQVKPRGRKKLTSECEGAVGKDSVASTPVSTRSTRKKKLGKNPYIFM